MNCLQIDICQSELEITITKYEKNIDDSDVGDSDRICFCPGVPIDSKSMEMAW
jgi:hypothetical protein